MDTKYDSGQYMDFKKTNLDVNLKERQFFSHSDLLMLNISFYTSTVVLTMAGIG